MSPDCLTTLNYFAARRLAAAAVLALTATAATSPAAFSQEAEDLEDDAPHVTVVRNAAGALELEFEVAPFSLSQNEDGIDVLTLDVSDFATNNLYGTIPVNTTPSPNDDLGFVAEFEPDTEDNITVQRLDASLNFAATLNGQIFANNGDQLPLGTGFDDHPTWLLTNDIDDLTPGFASFEVFNGTTSIGRFDLNLVVPEPASAALVLIPGLAALATRRRGTR